MPLPGAICDDVGFCESEVAGRKRVVERVADGDWQGGGDVKERDGEQHYGRR